VYPAAKPVLGFAESELHFASAPLNPPKLPVDPVLETKIIWIGTVIDIAPLTELVFIPCIGKLVCDTADDPGVNVKVQLAPGATLLQVFPVSVTKPFKAVEVKLDVILNAFSVVELFFIVIAPLEPLVIKAKGLPAVIVSVAWGAALTAILAVVTEVLLPLMGTLVLLTA
jgi:hypothetical protein